METSRVDLLFDMHDSFFPLELSEHLYSFVEESPKTLQGLLHNYVEMVEATERFSPHHRHR